MAAIEVGRVCYLLRGRNAGRKAVIVEIDKGTTVTVFRDGKKEKCNIRHLFPTRTIVDVKKLKKETAKEKSEVKVEKKKAK